MIKEEKRVLLAGAAASAVVFISSSICLWYLVDKNYGPRTAWGWVVLSIVCGVMLGGYVINKIEKKMEEQK